MYCLTKPQKLIYDMEKFAGGSIANVCGSIVIQGQKDISILENAVNKLFCLNDALRIRIVEKGGVPYQVVNEYKEQKINVIRFKDKAELDLYAEKYAKEPMDFKSSICDVNIVVLENNYGLLVKLHHIISDAWTLSLIGTQFNQIVNGETPVCNSYIDYIKTEDEYLNSKRYEKDKTYYIEQFKKCSEVTCISDKQSSHSYIANRKTFIVAADKTVNILEYAKSHNTSVYMLLMTTLGVYMNRIKMNQEKFYIGTAVLNRNGKAEKNTMGMFINTVPLLVELENEKSFSENLKVVSDSLFSIFRHQKFNYGDVLSALRSEFKFEGNLYDVMLSYQNAKISGESFESTWYHSGMQIESLQMHIDDRDDEGILKIHYDYLVEKFSEKEIEKMHEYIFNLLEDAFSEEKKIYELSILSQAEKDTLLYAFNDTKVDYPKDKCVHQLFEEQVLKTPDKTAVIACDITLTYDELNKLSNQIAHGLIAKEVKPNDIVAFALPRNSYLIAVMFGILKSGAAYMPIDPNYPQDRIDFMLEDSKARLLITEKNIKELFNNSCTDNLNMAIRSENLCYCIYTSGSTGIPKGTLLRHRGIVNLVTNLSIFKDLSQCKRFGFMTTITFDVATQEILTCLLNGFTGILMPERKETSVEEIVERIKQYKVDVIFATPTYFKSLTNTEDKAEKLLKTVKVVSLAGEKFEINNIVKHLGETYHTKFENQYGPVELHVIATATTVINGDYDSIGKPVGNNKAYIVDKYMQPMPIGITGELCIAGDGVGVGYLNRPELTIEKFIDNPFGDGKLYKTGDLAYWREDGNIAYVGRNDFQVKVRGLRIELGEIENAILSVDKVAQSVVIVRKDETGRQLICAFYTEKEPVDLSVIRNSISKKLPKYMMPHIFKKIDQMPLTSSGKVNRKALPEVNLDNIRNAVKYIAPVTEKQCVLVSAIKETLHIAKVGIKDNFFDLGGDSLKSIELIANLEKSGYKTDTKAIFDSDTIEVLAQKLSLSEKTEKSFNVIGDIPATSAQMRVYTAQSMQENSTLYNVPYCFKTEKLDVLRLQNAVNEMIKRHESLRTHFENKDGQIIQVIEKNASITVEKLNSDNILSFIRPFDLSKAPLIRVAYYENTVMVDMHHIITDGSSMPIFFHELNELYMGRSLENEPVQYREFALEENDTTESERYWLSVYNDELPELVMRTDFPRGQKQSFNGSAVYDVLNIKLHRKIKEKCKLLNVTPYVYYMGAFNILLSKFSVNEDIIVGVPISGRGSKYLKTIGMFVNTIALRNKPIGIKLISEFMNEVKENSVTAIANQDYPYGDLMKKLNIDVQGRNPLFDVMFAYQSEEITDIIFADKKAKLLPVVITTSKYDLTFNIMPRDNDVVLMAEYCTDLYKETTINRMLKGYKLILEQMLKDNILLKDISAISKAEINKLLYEFNNTKVDYPKDKCVHQLFEEQVQKTPNSIALKFGDKSFTFNELNSLANGLAIKLHDYGVINGDVVAIISKRSYHIVVAMLAIFKCGAAYLPIDYNYPIDRINTIVADAECKTILTYNVDYTADNMIEIPENIIPAGRSPICKVNPKDICGIIYTSGSTGTPKGALLHHQGLVNYTYASNALHEGGSCNIGFAIYTFDAFFLDLISPMLRGNIAVMATEEEQFNQTAFENLIKNNPGCNLFITPAKFKQFIDNCRDKDFYKEIHSICIGGEIFPQEFVGIFDKKTKVYNIYGPTECSMWMLECPIIDGDVTLGKPVGNVQVYILDKNHMPTPIGVTGELCIAGDGVGAGYLNRPELTAEKFVDNPFGEGKMYKTGDLAYWREDGNVVYVGRNDFQVKIRGLRIELGEIENAICCVENVLQAVVVVRKDENGRQLICAFYTEKKPVELSEIKKAILDKLPKYMMPHIFTMLEEMPLTPSGKINRKALPEVDLVNISKDVEYAAPATEKEIILCDVMNDILNADKVSILDNFFDLGGDSLKAIELISKLEVRGYKITVKNIFDCETIKDLADRLEEIKTEERAVQWTGDIPATDAQLRVYTAQSMQENSTLYNVPYCFKTENLDVLRIQNAVNEMIKRHESLRTHFENKDGKIIQVIEENASIKVERLNSNNILNFIRPFDLSKAPLIRVGYYENTVMVDMHHIITDGSSMPVFFHELNELYMERTLENVVIQYKEFTLQEQDYSENEKYWLSVYNDELPVLEINTDFTRGQKRTYNGKAYYDTIDINLHKKIKSKCKELNLTPYTFYAGAFNILLSKFSGNEDIVIGMPASGRDGRNLNTMGMFVNTIALRSKPVGTKTISEFLQEVKANSINAIENQRYPFGELIRKINIEPSNRNPLFDVMFAYQSEEMTNIVFGDKKAELLSVPVTTSKYDFTLNIMPGENEVVVMVEYCTDLYKETTIKRFIDGFKQVIFAMIDSELQIKDISAISEQEMKTLLCGFNDTKVDYPKDKCVHQLFEEQVLKTPDKTAVIACDKTLTYDELNKLSNRIAHGLIAKDVKPNDIVAFALPRNSYLIAVMFGILKSGAAYMPIDPDYPQDRIDFMLEDSKAKLFIQKGNLNEYISDNTANPKVKMTSDNYCYCIYTSGTTGNPKGTLIRHKNFVNFCDNNNNNYQHSMIKYGTRLISTFKSCFDAFGVDYALFLLNGRSLVLADDEEIVNAERLAYFIQEYGVDVIHSTPSIIKILCGNSDYVKSIGNAKIIMIAAENFTPDLYELLRTHSSARIFNGYGPSETTIGVSFGEINSADIHIGKPIANTQIYILDKYGKPMPIGQTGELCIAGDGVGAGYLNRPELTAEKFVDNPFGEGKMYKTGDLAYWREDGNIVYVGRNDFQVKIRGLRIELGEIENAICCVDNVLQAVVVVRKDENGRQLICAFYTEKKPVELSEIKKVILDRLPKYMMPHIFTVLDEMPLTPSGKVNRNALPEVDLVNISNDVKYVKPQTKLQKEIVKLMENVLNYSPVGLEDNFFDLGGDSLKAIEFVSRAHNEGIYFNLQNVFDHPAVKYLCECIENGDKHEAAFKDSDFTEINEILKKNKIENIVTPKKTEVGNILLAGATGYLGIHILADFLDQDAGIAYCLVRGEDEKDSRQRLKTLMEFYFDNKYNPLFDKRIVVHCADLQKKNFGLADTEYDGLVKKVTTVINAAASVKHYGSYKYFYESNVETVNKLIDFCFRADARLIHTSTLSVSGNSFGDNYDGYISKTEKHFYESSLYIGQPLENVYARSKFEAEQAVLNAMTKGMRANIMRMGNLTNRFSDLKFQRNYESNVFLNRVKAILDLGIFPDYLIDLYTECTPIDDAANAIMRIARNFSAEQTVFHINSTKVVYMDKMIEYFKACGLNMQVVDGKTFTEALHKTAAGAGTEYIFETFINDMDENDKLNYNSNIHIENSFTVEYLRRLGFEWSDIDFEYIRKYIEYFRGIGYLKV